MPKNDIPQEIDWNAPHTTILNAYNTAYKLPCWNLVLIRCTYDSPTQWTLFLTTTQNRVLQYLTAQNELHLWDSIKWTILESPDLDEADIFQSSERFAEWVKTEGRAELTALNGPDGDFSREEDVFNVPWPRYNYFIHVDAETLAGVHADYVRGIEIDEERNIFFDSGTRNSLLVVDLGMILVNREGWEESVEESRRTGEMIAWEEIDEENNFRKRVKGENLLNIYVVLLDSMGFESSFANHTEDQTLYWLTV